MSQFFNVSINASNTIYAPSLILVGPLFQIIGGKLLIPWVPDHVRTTSSRTHKWRMTWLARTCAAVSGVWSVMALYQSFNLRNDLMYGSSDMAVNLIIFSLGVHIAEMLDMLVFSKVSLLSIHHLAVIICFAGALFSSRAIGFAVLTLVTELNAVTNKTRILHIISYTDTQSLEYKINSYINIFTFFVRILIIFWMNNQAFQYFVAEPSLFYGCCSFALLFVNLWNLTVFKTLIVRDVFQKPKEQ